MRPGLQKPVPTKKTRQGFTIVEMLVAAALAGLVVAMVMTTFNYSGTSFAAMGNYEDLDRNSRNAVDLLSRQIRNSSALMSFTNSPPTLIFTNASAGTAFKLTYNAANRVLRYAQIGHPTQTLLTGCDQWSFSLYSKSPIVSGTNITFYGATNGSGQLDVSVCKVVNMTWKCSRSIFGTTRNTESIQTAEIVLRNKVY
jgi:prepilin-type N-terminal cleavage/methylation domain-containing protein